MSDTFKEKTKYLEKTFYKSVDRTQKCKKKFYTSRVSKNSSYLKFCSCRHCSYNMGNNPEVKKAKRTFRRNAKRFLNSGEYDRIENKISVIYID